MKFLREHRLFTFIICICAILRLVPLVDYQYTLDELSGLGRTQFSNFSDLIEKGVKTTDTHPALIQVFIFCLAKLFGYANWVIKLPFLLFGFGAIVYGYLISIKHFSKQAGIFSAIVLSFSLIFVFYAPIARMYVAGLFFSMAMLYYFLEIFFLKHLKISNYFFLGLFALLSALNQHINALFAFTLCLSGLLFLNKTNVKHYLITCALVVLCYLPHLPVTLYQLEIGGIGFDQDGWLPKPEWSALFSFLQVLLGTGRSWLVFFGLTVLCVSLNRKFSFNKTQVFLLAIFLVNYFIIYFYSVYRAPVFQNSVMLFSSVTLVICLCSLLDFKNHYAFYSAALMLSFVLLYKTYVKKDYYGQCVKTVFEYQFERSDHYKKLYGDKMVYPLFFDADTFMQKIYFHKYHTTFDFKLSSDSTLTSTKQLSHFIAGLSCDYAALASSMPAQQALVAEYFPYLVENTQTQAINYKVYSRRKEDQAKTVKGDKEIAFSDPAHPQVFSYGKLRSLVDRLSVTVDSTNEFPFDATAPYSTVIQSEGQMLLLTTVYKLRQPWKGNVTSCTSVNDERSNVTYMYNSREAGDYVIRPDSTVTVYSDCFFGTPHRQAKDHSKISCYVWNRGKENFTVMGFEIKAIDYWHQKWHFWE